MKRKRKTKVPNDTVTVFTSNGDHPIHVYPLDNILIVNSQLFSTQYCLDEVAFRIVRQPRNFKWEIMHSNSNSYQAYYITETNIKDLQMLLQNLDFPCPRS